MADQERQMNAAKNAANRLNGLKQSLSIFWGERNKREQNMLSAAMAVVLLGLIYTLLIDPAVSGRTDLEKKLPGLRQQAADVQALSKDAANSSGKASAPPAPMTRERLEASLAQKGLKPQNFSVNGELAKVQLSAVSFAGTIDWLADMQRSARLSVVEANVEALAQPDTVNASFTLRQQRSEQSQ
jgi:general secretion pathway protein M